jgi:signal transduction histidine kinase
MRDQFLSVAAHELKTPITALRLQAQLMLRDLDRRAAYDAEAVHRALQQIDAQSHKLDRLGKQLLDITRLDGGQLRLEPRTSDLSQIVAEAVASVRATLTPARVRLQLPSAPVLITADALRLEQVVGNLLDNAVRFSPGVGQIEVEVSEAEEGFVRLAVRDHGISIPPDKREHMFERFYQAHRSEHRSGLGLGLYISRRIVELHGGRIMAEFPPEGGTRFVVLLPAARAAP